MVIGRALNGIAQAIISTYAPAWVNEFSSKANQTAWIASCQGFGILGIALGAIVGSIAADNR